MAGGAAQRTCRGWTAATQHSPLAACNYPLKVLTVKAELGQVRQEKNHANQK